MIDDAREYEGADATYYDLLSRGVPGDVELYVDEARRAAGPVLELGCGTARVTLAFAEAGLSVVGVDLSEAMLSIARQKLGLGLSPDARARDELVPVDIP
jgi:SAM-dependent methyltransferase